MMNQRGGGKDSRHGRTPQGRQPQGRTPQGPRGGPMAGMMPGEKAKNFKGSVLRLLTYLRPVVPQIIIALAMAAVSVVFTVIAPSLMGDATNILMDGFKNGMLSAMTGGPSTGFIDFTGFIAILVQLGLLYLISAVFGFVQGWIMSGVARRVVYDLRREIDAKLDSLPLKYFDGTPRGEILARVTGDVDNIASTLQQNIMQIVTSVFTLIGVLIMMFGKSWQLTLICLVTIPVVMAFSMMVMKRSKKHFSAQWASNGALTGQIEEMYTGHAVVRAYDRQDKAVEAFAEENEKLYQSSYRAQFISGTVMPFMNLVNNLNFVIICLYGGISVVNGTMAFGSVQAMTQYSRQFSQPIQQIASIMNVLQSTAASAERVFELLDEPAQRPEPALPAVLEAPRGAVEFRDVSFSYSPDKPLIKSMNLTVSPGSRVAIVGPTGAGKTTLVNLLMRFYEIDGGSIEIDGVSIGNMRREDLRDMFGMVLQDTWLFAGSVRDNIAYGREGAEEGDVVRAAKEASADHFIRTLEHGYDTLLLDDATNISQGQRQLLTIARAFISNPSMLILDEATSSVDTRTELLIQRAMDRLMLGRTSFIIAHRLSTIRDADVILVMRDGAIVEQGSHDALMAQKGFYSELYNSQFTINNVTENN